MSENTDKKYHDQKIMDEIAYSLMKMKYGELVVTVHDSKVVQIEKRERKRFK